TGFQVLKHLSRLFEENETFDHGVPPMVRLICIDNTPPSAEIPGIEYVTLENIGGSDGEDSGQVHSLSDYPEISAWLPENLTLEEIRGSRLSGRAALFKNVDRVLAELKNGITEITRKRHLTGTIKRTPDVVPANVYLITSLCGCTGGGMFLDVAYIVRELFKRKGKKQPEMQGYFFLADTFELQAMERMDYLTANMVAALKELDFFMENMEDFAVKYRKNLFYISEEAAKLKPFDFAYLVSAVDISNIVTLEKVVGVSVFHAIATELGKGNKSFLSTASAQAFKPVRTGPFRGRYSSYSSLGVSSMVFPYRRVVEMGTCQFAANVTEEILEFVKTRENPKPWNNQLRDFLYENGLFEQNRTLKFSEDLLQGGQPRLISLTKYKKIKPDDRYEALVKDKKETDRVNQRLVESMETALEVQSENFALALDDTLLEIMANEDKGVRFGIKFLNRLKMSLEQMEMTQRTKKA
ncbi:MAG: tubulin-like doman-containing protein, partial [bacterium]|nr:tubulin-like doman-containing protein [bacterium]